MGDDPFSIAVWYILGISGVVAVAEAVGFVPKFVSRWINRNRMAQILETMNSLGIDVDQIRRDNTARQITDYHPSGNTEEKLKEYLGKFTMNAPIGIGETYHVSARSFIDAMGFSTSPNTAISLARYLASHWRDIITKKNVVTNDKIDFVITPKEGSPLLGYEVSKLLRKPFILHCRKEKFSSETNEFRAHFDCESIPLAGSRGLLVDDSTTGGSKALSLVEDLKKFQIDVSEFLVLFEPNLKDVREILVKKGINLHPIIRVEQ